MPDVECVCVRHLPVVSDSLWPHELQPARLLCPWDPPGKNTGVSCHFLLRGICPTGDRTCISCVSCIGRQILYHWATWEALWHRMSTNECYASVTMLVITGIQRAKSSWLPHLQMRKWRPRTVKKAAQSHTVENRGQAGKPRSSDPTVQTIHQKIF